MTASEALDAILAGHTVRVVVGDDPEDPTTLHYLDKCEEFDFEPMIYTESVAGWSGGVKEAVCEPDSDFYLEFMADWPDCLSIAVTEEAPPQRESEQPLKWEVRTP